MLGVIHDDEMCLASLHNFEKAGYSCGIVFTGSFHYTVHSGIGLECVTIFILMSVYNHIKRR